MAIGKSERIHIVELNGMGLGTHKIAQFFFRRACDIL
jgi:hypothetical protein